MTFYFIILLYWQNADVCKKLDTYISENGHFMAMGSFAWQKPDKFEVFSRAHEITHEWLKNDICAIFLVLSSKGHYSGSWHAFVIVMVSNCELQYHF